MKGIIPILAASTKILDGTEITILHLDNKEDNSCVLLIDIFLV